MHSQFPFKCSHILIRPWLFSIIKKKQQERNTKSAMFLARIPKVEVLVPDIDQKHHNFFCFCCSPVKGSVIFFLISKKKKKLRYYNKRELILIIDLAPDRPSWPKHAYLAIRFTCLSRSESLFFLFFYFFPRFIKGKLSKREKSKKFVSASIKRKKERKKTFFSYFRFKKIKKRGNHYP